MRPEPARYVVAGCRPWNSATVARLDRTVPGSWDLVTSPEQLDEALAVDPRPEFVFFLHWSWIVPEEVHEHHRCVVFHMTDLPYGRGGSPLQNLILAGHRTTMVTALRMTAEVDAGPVYAKAPLDLDGSAEAIYRAADGVCAELIEHIVRDRPIPRPQEGEPVFFARRRPEQSAVPADLPDLEGWYDFVRMLDAEGYPHAHIDHGAYRITFRRAERADGSILADAKIERREEAG